MEATKLKSEVLYKNPTIKCEYAKLTAGKGLRPNPAANRVIRAGIRKLRQKMWRETRISILKEQQGAEFLQIDPFLNKVYGPHNMFTMRVKVGCTITGLLCGLMVWTSEELRNGGSRSKKEGQSGHNTKGLAS